MTVDPEIRTAMAMRHEVMSGMRNVTRSSANSVGRVAALRSVFGSAARATDSPWDGVVRFAMRAFCFRGGAVTGLSEMAEARCLISKRHVQTAPKRPSTMPNTARHALLDARTLAIRLPRDAREASRYGTGG